MYLSSSRYYLSASLRSMACPKIVKSILSRIDFAGLIVQQAALDIGETSSHQKRIGGA